jgi:hypothetical protein
MVSYEQLLKEINDFGIYQKVRYMLICLAALLPPIVTYMQSFIAPKLPYRCAHPDYANDTFETKYDFANIEGSSIVSLDKCSIRYSDNVVTKCDKWVYERQYYQKTLTEEVCISSFCFNHIYFGPL